MFAHRTFIFVVAHISHALVLHSVRHVPKLFTGATAGNRYFGLPKYALDNI